MFEKINTQNLHHGYLIVGERTSTKQSLLDFLQNELKIQIVGNPDFSFSEYNTLTIDDARILAETQERKGFGERNGEKNGGATKKFFVISTNIITVEAQNALLKVFEEPTAGTHFFIIASQNTFLPTFLSRIQIIHAKGYPWYAHTKGNPWQSILKKSLPERLTLVAKLAGDISDEKKLKQDAIDLVAEIEVELVQNGLENNTQALKECQFAREALFSRGAMIKMILENLMLQI